MPRIKTVVFANQKGGVGKTTSAVNVAACLAASGNRVLLADCDPQGNATSGLGVSKRDGAASVYDLLIGRVKAADAVRKTAFEGLYIIPSGIDLVGAEIELVDEPRREFRLRDGLEEVKGEFDYIVLDSPPSLGLLTMNALIAADGVVVPLLCEYYSLEGLSQLTATVRQIQKRYNPALELTGVLVNMYDGRLNLSLQVLGEIKKYFGAKLFKTPVPRNVRLSEAPSYGEPINIYDKSSKGAKAYEAVASELAERCGGAYGA